MREENQHNFLGKGGFGEVFKGFWRGQDIAVKKLRKERLIAPDGSLHDKYIATIFFIFRMWSSRTKGFIK